MKKLLLPVLIALYACVSAQDISPTILTKQWESYWVTVPGEPADGYGVYNFRKVIDLSTRPERFVVHVSADNRYKLYVNETLVSLGPARGDLFHWNFETVDLAPFLISGRNCISAVVWNFGDERPEAQISLRTGFVLQGDTEKESIINSNKTWRCSRDERYSPLKPSLLYTYYVSGPGELVDNNKHPGNWQEASFDDTSWNDALQLSKGLPKGVFDYSTDWMLVPRGIPPMELTPQRLQNVGQAENITLPKNFPSTKQKIVIPASRKVSFILDQNFLTNAYPVLSFSKGKDAVVTLSYAEALYIDEESGDWRTQNKKGNRDVIENKRFVGVSDKVISNGQSGQLFIPLWWRTYRYIKIDIETKYKDLTIDDLYGIFTGYPFTFNASFTSTDKTLSTILETGWRTARLCAQETYIDCPYYEQLQYVGDTRIQALVSLFNSGDDRLMKNAITLLDQSRMAEGITLSRYPTAHAQQIPPFSLWWISMIHDYWMYRPGNNFVREKLPGIRQILNWYRGFQQDDGLLLHPHYWNFTDWAVGKGWSRGVPPQDRDGNSSALDLQLLWAYQLASELEAAMGIDHYATLYREQAEELKKSILDHYWDDTQKMLSDTGEKTLFSQHPNALAVLTDVVSGKDATQLMERTLSDTSITQATIYFKYYVHQAAAKVGLGNRYLEMLGDWHQQLENGLTTWAEISDHNRARSDCHAWGSSPNIEFFRIVLGIDTDAPGFSRVKVVPHLGKLTDVKGTIPHPNGNVSVSYTLEKKKWKVSITLPPNTTGRFVWHGREYELEPQENLFTF